MTGLRWFWAGLIGMVVFATGHFAGFLQAAHAARHEPGLASVTQAMREQRTELLGFSPSLLDFREYFSVNFSILMLVIAAVGAILVSTHDTPLTVVRLLAPLYAAAMLVLLGTSYFYSVVQGMVMCAMLAVLFALAWWRA
jgi:pheromone shutdown protein TraB